MELEKIVKSQNTNPQVLCDYAEKVNYFSTKWYWCTYQTKCVYQTKFFHKQYCTKELDRNENIRTENKN